MNIKNPCIGVCKFDEATQLCKGCLRTREERKTWKSLSEEAREQIVTDRPKREGVLEASLALADVPEKGKAKKKGKTKAEKKAKKAKKKAKRLAKKKSKTKRKG